MSKRGKDPKREQKKEQKLTPVSNVLENLLSRGESPLSDQFLRWRVWHSWSGVVGEKMSQYSIPVGFYDGTLVIWVKSASYAQELSYGLDILRNRVNSFLGFAWVTTIRLTQDRRSVPKSNAAQGDDLRDSISKTIKDI